MMRLTEVRAAMRFLIDGMRKPNFILLDIFFVRDWLRIPLVIPVLYWHDEHGYILWP